jgi:hypothetical protein
MPRPISSGRMRNVAGRPGGRRVAGMASSPVFGGNPYGAGIRPKAGSGRHAMLRASSGSRPPIRMKSPSKLRRATSLLTSKKGMAGMGLGAAVLGISRKTGPGATTVKGRPTGVYQY